MHMFVKSRNMENNSSRINVERTKYHTKMLQIAVTSHLSGSSLLQMLSTNVNLRTFCLRSGLIGMY
jgi:hypothetical protein